MRLPATSAPLTFLMDPSRKYVQFNQFAYPALQALSVFNRATDTAVIQSTSANQPVWSQAQIAGTYSGRNYPGYPGVAGVSPGIPGLLFSGSQYMESNDLAALYAGAEVPVTVTCQVACGSSGGTIWSFGSANTRKLSLSYAGGTLSFTEINGSGTFTAAATVDTAVHTITATRANGFVTLRVDGAQAATTAVTASTQTFTTFAVGALHTNGSVSSQFNGSIGKLAVYSGAADVLSVETFMLQDAGVIRGPSSGINSGF